MTRSVPEWIGKNAESNPPPRVRLRVFDRYDGRCQCGCNRKIMAGEAWDLEDTIAIVNGGERRESNFKPWLKEHHKGKTARDVREKSIVRRKRMKSLGIAPKKGRPMPGSKASGIRKRMDGTVERR